jgi:hypothetical protein
MPEHPPTNDPTIPSYQCPEYLRFRASRELLNDCFEGDLQNSPNIKSYLPKERAEPDDAYKSRINRSPYENHVATTIKSFAGAIAAATWSSEEPDWLEMIEEDFDLGSNSLDVVVDCCDITSLLDGYCFVLVDYYRSGVENRAQEMVRPSRPFVRIVPAGSAPNFTQKNGMVKKITIAEQMPIESDYGSTLKPVYRVINGDRWRVVELVDSGQKRSDGSPIWIEKPVIDLEGKTLEGQFTNGKGQPLGYCPIVPYCLGGEQWRKGSPPEFLVLARHNIALYQAMSDLIAIVRSLAPTPWIRSDATAKLSGSGNGFLSLGPHDWLDLGSSPHAGCGLLQGNPEAVAPARQLVQDIRHQIYADGLSLKSSSGDDGRSKAATATEIRARFNEVQKRLKRFADGKQSALNSMLKMIADYNGDDSVMPRSIVTADISALLSSEDSVVALYNAGLLSKEAAVTRLEQLGYNNNAGEELERLAAAELGVVKAVADKMSSSGYD